MGRAIINGFIQILVFFVNIIGSIIFVPIQSILINYFPDLANFNAVATDFIVNDLLPVVGWIKGFITYTLHFEPTLMQLIVAEFFAYLSLAIVIRTLLLLYRLILFLRGNPI